MLRKSLGRGLGGIVSIMGIGMLFCPQAGALDIIDMDVTHINYDDQLPFYQSSAAISAKMCLDFLGDADEPLQDIFNYGRSLNSSFTPDSEFDESMLVGTMENYVPDEDYVYAVIHGTDFDTVVGQIGYWMNRDIPDVSPNPTNAPAMIPLGGDYDNWVVVMGTRAEDDPYTNPGTWMYGLWLDDCRLNNESGMVDTRIYHSTSPTASPSLTSVFVPMTTGAYTGEYVAVVPVASATLPTVQWPGLTLVAVMVVGVACAACMRRTRQARS